MSKIRFDQNEKVRFVDQLENLFRSTLLRHDQLKCFQNDETSFEFVSCPLKCLENSTFSHPFSSIFLQTFEKFHQKHRGASSKTFVAFFVKFYRNFSPLVDRKTLEKLETILDETLRHAENVFKENFDEISPEFSRRICRSNEIFSKTFYEMFVDESKVSFDRLHHLTRVKSGEEQLRLIRSFLLPIQTSFRVGTHRTVFLDGHLIENFQHIGFNKTKSMKIRTISTRSNWLKIIEEILDENQIEMIILTGTIDERLKSRMNLSVFENISIRFLRFFGENRLLNYLTDVEAERNIFSLNFRLFDDDETLVQIDHGFTLLHYVPTAKLVDVKHHQLEHCLGRFNEILRTKTFLCGSAEFEENLTNFLRKKIQENSSSNDENRLLLLQAFRQCFESFRDDLKSSKDLYETNFIDDCSSKFDALRTSFHLVKLFLQIDSITKIVQDEEQLTNSDL